MTPERRGEQVERIIDDPAFPPGTAHPRRSQHRGSVPKLTTAVVEEMAYRWREHAANLGKTRWAIILNGAWDTARHFEFELEGPCVRHDGLQRSIRCLRPARIRNSNRTHNPQGPPGGTPQPVGDQVSDRVTGRSVTAAGSARGVTDRTKRHRTRTCSATSAATAMPRYRSVVPGPRGENDAPGAPE